MQGLLNLKTQYMGYDEAILWTPLAAKTNQKESIHHPVNVKAVQMNKSFNRTESNKFCWRISTLEVVKMDI